MDQDGSAHVIRDGQFQLLLLANVFAALGIHLFTPILETLTGVTGVSASRIGLLVTAFSLPGIVMIPLAGVLTDYYGRKPILVGGLLLFGTCGSLLAVTTDFQVMIGLRLLQGMGFGGTIPVIVASIGDLYVENQEAAAQGFRFSSSGASQTVFTAVASVLVGIAWYSPFLIYTLAIPVALLLLVGFEEPDVSTAGTSTGDESVNFLRFVFTPRTISLLVLRILPHVALIAFFTYNSIYIVNVLDGSPLHAGLLASGATVVYALTGSFAGRIVSQTSSVFYPLVGGNASLMVGLSIFAVSVSLPIAAVGTVFIGIGVGLTFTLYRSIITTYAPVERRGSLVSLSEGLAHLVMALTPLGVGLLIELTSSTVGFTFALRSSLVATALFVGIGSCPFLLISRPEIEQI